MKNPWIIIGVLTVLLFGGAIWYSSVAAERNNEGVTVTDHIKGNPDAEVVLVEYSDFQCPACAAFQPVVADVLSEYGDEVRFEYRHYPLPTHPHALSASMAAEAAGQQDAFFAYHDLLFENQPTWSAAAVPETYFVQYAEELGLDIEQFRRHLNSSLLRDAVLADRDEGRDRRVTGTPTFFLNGNRMEYSTYQGFVDQVAQAVDPNAVQATTTDASTGTQNGVRFGI